MLKRIVEKALEIKFQERKLPHEAFRDETAMAISKVGVFGVIHLAFNKYWVMKTLPVVTHTWIRKIALRLISLPMCIMACMAYVQLGNTLEKSAVERKKQTALKKEQESKKEISKQVTDITSSLPVQSEALQLLSTHKMYTTLITIIY